MTDINWQIGKPPRNGNYLVETKDDFAIDYWFEHTWDDNGSNVIAWLPIEGDRVELVRCKDCKYFKTYPPTEDQDYTIYDCERLNYCTDNAVGNKPEDFCSKGESTMGQLNSDEPINYHIENDGTYEGGE